MYVKPYSRAFSFTAHSKAPFVQISTRDFERRLIKEQLSDGNLTRHGNANILTASLGCRGVTDIEAVCYMKVALSCVFQ